MGDSIMRGAAEIGKSKSQSVGADDCDVAAPVFLRDDLCRVSGRCAVGRDALHDNGPRPDNHIVPNRHILNDGASGADVYVVSDSGGGVLVRADGSELAEVTVLADYRERVDDYRHVVADVEPFADPGMPGDLDTELLRQPIVHQYGDETDQSAVRLAESEPKAVTEGSVPTVLPEKREKGCSPGIPEKVGGNILADQRKLHSAAALAFSPCEVLMFSTAAPPAQGGIFYAAHLP